MIKLINNMRQNKKALYSHTAKFPSELRMDVVSNDWVVIASARAHKPEKIKKGCPFCDIKTQKKPTLVMVNGKKATSGGKIPKDWTTVIIPNKYPAFVKSEDLNERFEGPFYKTMNAVGFHEIVVTKNHKKQIADFKLKEVKELLDAYQERYLGLMNEKFVNHISIFHNHGFSAGASISHPHSQIITTSLLDPDLKKALSNAKNYFENKKSCIYCGLNEWEKKIKKRIVFTNEDFMAICPFASKSAFEVIITPKRHTSYFERITEKEKWNLAEIFQKTMKKICKALKNPDYNFYLHTAPCDGGNHEYYHWHWTILPKTSEWAGFEIGTRIEISTIEPERAAEILRKL